MELLSFEETRIIGSLIEKEFTTPEYYPLTINSLTNACNQKSSRNPVVTFSETQVESIIQNLRDKSLVSKVTGPDLRVPKYRQIFSNHYEFSKPQIAVICVLFLRGAQTIGEIKSRSYRIYEFKDLSETEDILDKLINNDVCPYIVKLPKESGRENRYTHLFCGEPKLQQPETELNINERVVSLENEVTDLKEMLSKLKTEFESFKSSFE